MIIKNLPQFKSVADEIKFLADNHLELIERSKSVIKMADSVGSPVNYLDPTVDLLNIEKSSAYKSFLNIDKNVLLEKDVIEAKVVMNTTNILDSHKDVHIKGLWDDDLKDKSVNRMHIQEHNYRSFKNIISSGDDLKIYTKDYTWKQLGYDFEGSTQALEFKSKIRKERNPYMHEQYAKGWVNNHSVGMFYNKILFCLDSDNPDHAQLKENYDNYAEKIVNQNSLGRYFWAVTKASFIEGSAVPMGSNFATPTTSIKSVEFEKKEGSLLKWLKS